MKLTVNKIEAGGVSTVNKVWPCAVCNKFTDATTGPLLDIRLSLTTPRNATTYGSILRIHTACLEAYIAHAKEIVKLDSFAGHVEGGAA